MCAILLFVSVILFVYDSDQYGTAATSGEKHFMTTFYIFQSLPFAIEPFIWNVLAVTDPPFPLHFFTVDNIMVCSEVPFS